ncbi:uncharacterized protein [Triticum aestivum]|uniref:uncharacterized protein n=1 Tax=Triticum aestivum TaxID=4565 RepID=UPI001D02238D|nr:uncharacterized protein LOC123104920 [Triticum aestivum]
MHCSHCRDPNHKRPGCPILHPELKLQPQRRNNEEDIDDPSILEHIVPEEGIPELIPTQCSETLVDELLVEEITELENFHSRRKGPLPSNAFVEEHINNIPAPRATTATRGGMAIARGRGKGRGRGRGRATSSATSTSILDDVVPTTRGRARARGTTRRASTSRVTGSISVVNDAIGASGAASNMVDDVPRASTRRPRSGGRGDGAAREREREVSNTEDCTTCSLGLIS